MDFDAMQAAQLAHHGGLDSKGQQGGNLPSPPLLHHANSGDLAKLLAFDNPSIDLELPLPVDMFDGEDGNELLNLEFPALHQHQNKPDSSLPLATSGQGQGHHPRPNQSSTQLPNHSSGRPVESKEERKSDLADAARSVLASLDAAPLPGPQGQGPNLPAVPATQALPGMHQAYSQAPFAMSMNTSMSVPFPTHHAGHAVYIDPMTGQFMHLGPPMAYQWPGSQQDATAQHGLSSLMMTQGHQLLQPLAQPQSLQFVPGLSGSHGPIQVSMDLQPGGRSQSSPSRKSPSKRRRPSRARDTETMSQRTARAEQGFTYDPVTGRMFRHGPALMATARDNREVPVVKTLFDAFQAHNGFSDLPPPTYAAQQQAALRGESGQGQISGATAGNQQENQQQQQQQQSCAAEENQAKGPLGTANEKGREGSPAPSTSSSHLLQPEPTLPCGRQLNAQTGHGFITSLVTRELQSSTPTRPPLLGEDTEKDNDNDKDNAFNNKSGDGNVPCCAEGVMVGVVRDKWSLFWDAFVEVPAHLLHQESPSDKIETVFLGKFPTRDQAGRAHDIAALKLLGEAAITNFPRETYLSTLPILAAHSGEEVVAALKKDSELALQRTSKYKGVRRTGPGQFEARADIAVVSAGDMPEPSAPANIPTTLRSTPLPSPLLSGMGGMVGTMEAHPKQIWSGGPASPALLH